MSRPPTHHEINLTQQDLAFKQAVLTDVEARLREILPTLVGAVLKDEIGDFIEQTIHMVNNQEVHIGRLNDAVFPPIEGATDEPETADES